MKMIDLHVHSIVSDGSYTPTEIAGLAAEKGLAGFALTDHESIQGIDEAAAAAHRLGVSFLPGIEISVEYRERRLHILALGFVPEHPAFVELYQKIRSVKEAKIPELIAGIRARGIEISEDVVRLHAAGRIDRYAIMRYLVGLRLFDRAQPLWDQYINPVVRELGIDGDVPAAEVFAAIHAAGGITSLAHFHKRIGLKGLSRAEQEAAIRELHELGLDGMEQWYPSYTDEDAAFAAQLIAKYGLLPTGGTDFHGTNRVGIELGSGFENNLAVPWSVFAAIGKRTRGAVLADAVCLEKRQ